MKDLLGAAWGLLGVSWGPPRVTSGPLVGLWRPLRPSWPTDAVLGAFLGSRVFHFWRLGPSW
eukprot:8324564-Pyramimonas_sp.AAC.1